MVQIPWLEQDWLDSASSWITARLDELGMQPAGTIAQSHIRPWSTVLQVPTRTGELFFKAVSSQIAFETPLTEFLAQRYQRLLPKLLAVDRERGWMLMAAEGPRLREVIRVDRDLRHWERILPEYAELQMGLAGQVDYLLALGTPDRRPAALPDRFAELLDDEEALGIGRQDGVRPAELARLRALLPRLSEMCLRLGHYGIPVSLNHGDFHDGNIFLRDDGFAFIDWGDACIGHPFFSFRTVCVSVEISLDLPENPPECERLRAAYLEPWTRYAPRRTLEAVFDLAYAAGVINGALTWRQALAGLPTAERAEYAYTVPALLHEFLGLPLAQEGP